MSDKSTSRPPSSRPQDFPIHSIEHEYDDAASLSGSAQQSSGPDETVFDGPISRNSSPRTSQHSDDNESISSFFPESRGPSCPPEHQPSSPYTPLKMRSPFRNPSSVRAMQMETTPPPYIPPSLQQRNLSTTSSRHGTPRSIRSSHRGSRVSPSKLSPTKKTNMRKEYPLVLLHVTLLPIPQTYSSEVMEQVLPSYILENWKILREKVTDTVLERGILIPHPREDYDLMEERLLESLDLKTPRILKCGHFHLDPEEDTDVAGSDEEGFDEEDNEADFCADCGRKVRDGKYGSGNGSRRWDIKVYAANGLMRAGAWGAAWREMERVDVEITPWMDEVVKRELALRAEEERKHTALLQEGNAVHEVQAPLMDAERMREIYGDDSYIERDKEDVPLAPQPSQAFHQSQREVPLRDLLKNYVMAAAQDRKNIAIFLLSMFVLYLSMASGPALPNTSTPSPHHPLGQSVSTSVPARTDVLSMSTSFPSSLESSIVQASATEITASAPKEQTVAVASSSSTVSPTGDSMDWIEARFEFAGE
ncbi:MAG: hypothetical protein LQ346_000352 [Caloplaca aetnensis]|nr:MAG: hypothetical protein LQ346_000352 [Caloplaca aetnensis]